MRGARRERSWLPFACARLLAGLAVLALGATAAPSAQAQQPAPTPPVAIDGPTDIPSPSGLGLSVARDGTGGLVYAKQVGGASHVFVSFLQGGSFQAPIQVDTGLSGASSQPVVAAGQGGLLLIAFVNGGELYVTGRTAEGAQLSAPAGLAQGGFDPAISISNFGKAYLAFAVPDGPGDDVRAAYYYNGRWALESPSLNAAGQPDDAGTGSGAPAVATAGDGVGIVVWGEQGHIFSRRVWGTDASVAVEQADAPPAGCTEASADSPVVGTEGDSSYAQVAFHEVVTCNGQQLSRVLANRLQGSVYDGLEEPDGLTSSSADGAVDPQIAMGEYGHGWITSVRSGAHDVTGTAMGDQGTVIGTTQVNSLSNAAAPDAVPALAGLYSTFIAWQQNPGSAGAPEIRVRYAPDGATLGPEVVVSSPAQGPTEADAGLAAAGDVNGDAAIAWLQGTPGATWVMAEQMYQGPGPIYQKPFHYENTPNPVLQWTAANEAWGPMSYSVSIDGAQVAQTGSTAVRVQSTVPDGPHGWQVTGTNPAGQSTRSRTATVFIDTVPPVGSVNLYGRRQVGTLLHVYVRYADLPPAGDPPADASGVAKVVLRWGDGKTVRLAAGIHRSFHAYLRPGRYVISLRVIDKAGNASTTVIHVVIKPKPKPKHRRKGAHGKGTGTSGTGKGTTGSGTSGAASPTPGHLR